MISNKASFDMYELSVIFGEDNVICDDTFSCLSVSTDSRKISGGELFVALKGESFDGHDKVIDAFDSGAVAALVSKDWYDSLKTKPNNNYILCKDTLDGLGKLARFHRDRFRLPVVAIAGSNGKTTTKEICSSILELKFKTLKTYKNFNNRVGVPLMLLSLDETYEAAVLEIGTNEPGEIAMLSNICNPTHGLITNIGKEHLEFLLNLDGVEMEETFLFGYLRSKGGIALINMDDDRLSRYEPILDNKLSFGSNDSSGLKASYSFDETLCATISFEYEETKLSAKLQIPGIAPALNAIAAAAVGFILELPAETIAQGIERFNNQDDSDYGRMKVINYKDCIILNDTYNANPSSMMMSLQTLDKMSSKSNKIAVLGDMFELGKEAEAEHLNILLMAANFADEVLLLGDNMRAAHKKTGKGQHFENHEGIAEYLKNATLNSAILVKGSRGMKMEKVVNILLGK